MARVLLVFGGRSAEHEVSCISAVAVADALEAAGHSLILVGIDRSGVWHMADRTSRPLVAEGERVQFQVPDGSLLSVSGAIDVDVVFSVLHGPYGEDGTIQGTLEMAGVPYVGCNVLASATAMHKPAAKVLASAAGVPTMNWLAVDGSGFAADPGAVVSHVAQTLGLPVFVKPAELGSSVGVTKATTEAEVKEAVEEALRHGNEVIVEECIRGREIEVAVLDGPRASLPGEIITQHEWYDFEAKYEDATSRFVCPASLTNAQVAHVRHLAEQTFTALRCSGLARIDFFFEEQGRGFLLNEVNTMPGFTPISGFPKMWEATGMSYPELCNHLVTAALPGRV